MREKAINNYDVNMKNSNSMLVKRLKNEMKRVGVNPRELSIRANVGKSFVYDILSGKSNNPTTSKLAAIADALGVSVPYLVSGSSNDNEIMNIGGNNFSAISTIITTRSDKDHELFIEASDQVHFFNRMWIHDQLKTTPDKLRVAFAKGDSMQPSLFDGDMILVNVDDTVPNPGGLFVLFDNTGFSFKRLEYTRRGNKLMVIVKADNAKYTEYECLPEEIQIVGRIVWFSRIC